MKLQFLGHACFLLDDGVHKVLTDPFLTGGGHPEWAEKVDPDVIFVTHGHGDHVVRINNFHIFPIITDC